MHLIRQQENLYLQTLCICHQCIVELHRIRSSYFQLPQICADRQLLLMRGSRIPGTPDFSTKYNKNGLNGTWPSPESNGLPPQRQYSKHHVWVRSIRYQAFPVHSRTMFSMKWIWKASYAWNSIVSVQTQGVATLEIWRTQDFEVRFRK